MKTTAFLFAALTTTLTAYAQGIPASASPHKLTGLPPRAHYDIERIYQKSNGDHVGSATEKVCSGDVVLENLKEEMGFAKSIHCIANFEDVGEVEINVSFLVWAATWKDAQGVETDRKLYSASYQTRGTRADSKYSSYGSGAALTKVLDLSNLTLVAPQGPTNEKGIEQSESSLVLVVDFNDQVK